MTVIVSQNSVVPEPRAGKKFPQGEAPLFISDPTFPTWAVLLLSVYQETRPAAAPTLREPLSLKKILKASANVCREPQEQGCGLDHSKSLGLRNPHRHGLKCP